MLGGWQPEQDERSRGWDVTTLPTSNHTRLRGQALVKRMEEVQRKCQDVHTKHLDTIYCLFPHGSPFTQTRHQAISAKDPEDGLQRD